MKVLLLLLSLLLACGSSFAQANAKPPAAVQAAAQLPQPTVAPQLAAQPVDTPMSEKDYYKQLADTRDKATDSAISATQWTIGIMAGLFAIIFGSQFLYNSRLNTVELEKITAELQAKISTLESSLRGKLSDETTQAASAATTRAQALELQLREANNRELDSFKQLMDSVLAGQKQEMMSSIDGLTQRLSKVPRLLDARIALENKDYDKALGWYILVVEADLKTGGYNDDIDFSMYMCIYNIAELNEYTYDRLSIIDEYIASKPNSARNLIGHTLNVKPVFRMVQKEGLGGNMEYIKEYIKNTPTNT